MAGKRERIRAGAGRRGDGRASAAWKYWTANVAATLVIPPAGVPHNGFHPALIEGSEQTRGLELQGPLAARAQAERLRPSRAGRGAGAAGGTVHVPTAHDAGHRRRAGGRPPVAVWRDGCWKNIAHSPNCRAHIDFGAPDILCALYPILEATPKLCLKEHDGEVVDAHPMFRVFATGNSIGGDRDGAYHGTQPLNVALLNRFSGHGQIIKIEAMKPKQDKGDAARSPPVTLAQVGAPQSRTSRTACVTATAKRRDCCRR